MNYLSNRIRELFRVVYALQASSSQDLETAKDLLKSFKESGETPSTEQIAAFKKNQFFNNLKFTEIDQNLRLIVELSKMAKLMDVETDLTEEEQSVVKASAERFKPMYIYDKNTLVFFNKDLEAAVDNELSNPSETDAEAFMKLVNTINNGR